MQIYSGLTKKAQLWIAFLFLLLFLVVSSYASLIYSQYKVERQISEFRGENDRLLKENRDKWIALVRLSLLRVVEKENKANMNRIRPGEHVIVINDDESKNFVLKEQKTESGKMDATMGMASVTQAYASEPNPRKWWYFFFPPTGPLRHVEQPIPTVVPSATPQ